MLLLLIKPRLLIILSLVIILNNESCCASNEPSSCIFPKPLAVVIERSSWSMVTNSETPKLVLYEDGTIIYEAKSSGFFPSYKKVQLNRSRLNKLKQSIGPTDEFIKLKSYYGLGSSYDLPTIDVYLSNNCKSKAVSVYGASINSGKLSILAQNLKAKSLFPKEFGRVVTLLSNSLLAKSSTDWYPDQLEIIIWPYDNSPIEPKIWPKGWPDTNSSSAFARGNSSYSLFMPFYMKNEIFNYFAELKYNQAILIDGKKWAYFVRAVFPCESQWLMPAR